MQLPPVLRGARAAFAFYTRIPVGGFPYSPADWQWASGWFPLVGACLGGLLALVWLAVERAGPFAAAALVVGAGMLLTGAFHEDGLADTADALGGAYERARLFEILKDSRIGSFGAAALVVVLVLRIALLARLQAIAPLALVLTGCMARTPPIWLMVALPYVTSSTTSRSQTVARITGAQAMLATACPVLLMGGLLWTGWMETTTAWALLAAAGFTALVCGWRFWVRAGGITGDFLGATQQIAECALLLVLALTRGEAA
ncbi:adenosylcobinamide-GDP ribazoletransferase [Archangium violaceum]|uniref:adenosylcobinamide-GDP ribazoletransferase n=1 Tax=Archangium violaceum TaxID=83451 RepID=UPI002B2FA696|nr:adenosylcobinamide-GDP ribazoletransferase [Archangium violaceum]